MSGANNVKQYITAYNTKISTATGGAATSQIGRKYSTGEGADWCINSYGGQSNSETPAKKLLNPSGIGGFWLGSSYSDPAHDVHYVSSNGSITRWCCWGSAYCGVRPVIKITYSTT